MRSFAYGAVCLALWAAACGSDDDKRSDRGAEAGAAGADSAEGGSTSAGTSGSADAGEGTTGLGGATLGGAGDGSSGETGSSGAGGIEPGAKVNVTGQLVSPQGAPLAGVRVEVSGEAVTTGENGEFAAEAVVPYDIVVRHTETDTDVYLGVTRKDPKIVGLYSTANRSATLTGKLSGVGYPVPAGHETELTIRGVDVGFSNRQAAGSNGDYVSSGSPAWTGGETTQATLFALQHDLTTGAFTAIGSKVVTLTDQEQLTSPEADLTLVAAVPRDLDVTISAPAGIDYSTVVFFVGNVPVTIDSPSSEFTLQVPEAVPEEVGLVLNLDAMVDGRRTYVLSTLPSSTESLDLEIGVPPAATSPADEATLSATTGAFRFTAQPGAVSRVRFRYAEILSGGELRIDHYTNVMTDDASLPLSRLLALDLDLPADEPMTWTVESRADAPTVDAYLAPTHDSVSDQRGGMDEPRVFRFQE
ncbi:MAG: carboxypeptidase regulatory-like domain-containing protein [Myxococcales bacterium]|nr:MAG: carboxypeptidase regulatory-like domain-containing protein [Myxococcales bacterium]